MKALFFLLVFFIAVSCSREQLAPSLGIATFSMSTVIKPQSGGRITQTSTPAFVLLSIEDGNAKTLLQNKKLSLYSFGQGYVSESLELTEGTYKLVQFQVINAGDTVIYASPLAGSPLAQYVTNPLPISFTITKDASTQVVPQVLAVTTTDVPQNFGYASFGFEIVTPKLRLKKIFYSNYQDTINYTYSGNNLASVFTSDKSFLANYYYDAYGRLNKIDRYQDNVFLESLIYDYDSIGRLQAIDVPTIPSNHNHRIFSYTNGHISSVDVTPGELSFHEKRFIEYDNDFNPVKITIHGYDSNDQESWVTTELYTFDSKLPVTNSFPSDLFVGLTYVLPNMNHFAGLTLSHNITSLSTSTYWLADNTSFGPVKASSVYEYNSLGYPIKETIYTTGSMAYYPISGTVKQYVYE